MRFSVFEVGPYFLVAIVSNRYLFNAFFDFLNSSLKCTYRKITKTRKIVDTYDFHQTEFPSLDSERSECVVYA